ncbi:MAG: hypothetical protein NC548_22865 [Lachnospiraceae bacterium]|nr:hypothetical protein [Lachnospiraceae bacterium]
MTEKNLKNLLTFSLIHGIMNTETREGHSIKPERKFVMTEKKITKAQRFADVRALLTGDTPAYGTTQEEAIAFIDYELELLARKADRKPTEEDKQKMEQNENDMRLIINFLCDQPEPVTSAEIFRGIPEFLNRPKFTNQKVTSLVIKLLKEGKIEKETDKKGVSRYSRF